MKVKLKIKIKSLLYLIFSVFPLKNKKIVVSSYYGRGYGDNGKYILEELNYSGKDYDLVWLTSDIEDEFPAYIRVVKSNSLLSIFEMATAKVWIDNSRKSLGVRKRKNQFYLQTWHSSLRLKLIERDAEKYLTESYINRAKIDSTMCDLMISGSNFAKNIYEKSFWYNGEILESGTPRCDIFFKDTKLVREKILSRYNIEKNTKLVLYAPTFRNGDQINIKSFNPNDVIEACKDRFGGEWKVLFRLHPNVSSLSERFTFSENLLDVTMYEDMQELLCASDFLVTDYSSSMFDMMIAEKKCMLFVPDLVDYTNNERGTYFNIYDLPFEYALNSLDLSKKIKSFDFDKYRYDIKEFKDKIGMYEDGNASKKVAQRIIDVIEMN